MKEAYFNEKGVLQWKRCISMEETYFNEKVYFYEKIVLEWKKSTSVKEVFFNERRVLH